MATNAVAVANKAAANKATAKNAAAKKAAANAAANAAAKAPKTYITNSLDSFKDNFDATYDSLRSGVTGLASSVSSSEKPQGAPGQMMSMTQALGKVTALFFGIIIVIGIISLLVHYFITPIYRSHPGAPGIITVPGSSKGDTYWNGKGTYPIFGEIKKEDLPISGSYYNYSLIMDIFIQSPGEFTTPAKPRILFCRGGIPQPASTTSIDLVSGVIKDYNLAIVLASKTTDLIVSVLDKDRLSMECMITNIPVQKAFRLGIVLMEKAMEVYINGFLSKTLQFNKALLDIKTDINPESLRITNTIAKIRNLTIWNSVLTSPEIAQAEPPMASDSDFNATPLPTTQTCPTTS